MTIGPERGYQKEYGHPCKQKHTGSEVIILIAEEKIHYHRCHIGKPKHVRNDKYFTEWNVIIKGYMNDPIMTRNGSLQMTEPRHIYDTVNNQWKSMPVFPDKLNERAAFLCDSRIKLHCFVMTLLKLFHNNNSPFTQSILCMLQATIRI